MKVILLEDIKGFGKRGQLIEAADGHARNFLLPRKLAVEATKANMNILEAQRKALALQQQQELEAAQVLAKKIEASPVDICVKIGGSGKLFGSVTNKEVAEALKKQRGIDIDKKRVVLTEAIKTGGQKTAHIKLHQHVTASLFVNITEG